MLLVRLGAGLIGNLLKSKGTIITGKSTIRDGEGTVRVGQDFQCHFIL